ncbi:MAG: hypothetical protein JXB07_07130 [Anaerolineae bacterium]|nr:hypothetical protein [Anaerolineae bacterium]
MTKKRTSRSTRSVVASRSAALSQVRTSGGSPAPTDSTQLEAQYKYVIDDLKRIGLIAVTLIGGLVVLSLFVK